MVIAIVFFAVHTVLVLRQFPVDSVKQNNPLMSGDLVWHFADVLEGDAFLRQESRLWGYSITYMAGYPFGLWNSVARRGYETVSSILPILSVHQAYYASIVFMAAAPPLVVALAGLIVGDDIFAVGLLILTVVVCQFGSMISYFWTFGNVGFIFAGSVCLLYCALLFAACKEGRWAYAVGAGVVLGAVGWLHQLVIFPAMIVSLVVLIVQRRALLVKWKCLLPLSAFLIGFLIVLPWLSKLIEFIDVRRTLTAKGALESGWKYMLMDFFSDRAYRHPFDRKALFHVLFVFGGFGAWRAWRSDDKGIATFFLSGLGILLCGYVFPYIGPLRETQPYRFVIMAKLFLLIPAWWGMRQFIEIVKGADHKARVALSCMALILVPSITAYCFDFASRMPARGLTEEEQQTVAWFKQQGELRGRIVSDNWPLSTVLPYFINGQMLSGPLPDTAAVINGWANVGSEISFGRKTEELDSAKLKDYLMLYNVQYVVCSGLLADKMALLKDDYYERIRFGNAIRIFAAKPDQLNWLIDSTNDVRVSAGPNRIKIENAPLGIFILKYHYWRTLYSSGNTRISPVSLMEDPVPFIRVDNMCGLKSIEIRNRY
jgi:hypothetical protein